MECGSQDLLQRKSGAAPLSADSQAQVKRAWEAQLEFELKSNTSRELCAGETDETLRRVLLEFGTSAEADICLGMMRNQNGRIPKEKI